MRTKEQETNNAAFWHMEENIKASYAYGQFIAIMGGEIVADAADFDELHAKVKAAGKNPREALIVQAGHEYLKYATIFVAG